MGIYSFLLLLLSFFPFTFFCFFTFSPRLLQINQLFVDGTLFLFAFDLGKSLNSELSDYFIKCLLVQFLDCCRRINAIRNQCRPQWLVINLVFSHPLLQITTTLFTLCCFFSSGCLWFLCCFAFLRR